MNLDFNELLRIMSCILIILLIIQGLDYIFGFGVNRYLFIMFCITFAFTMGSIYHNIIMERRNAQMETYNKNIQTLLESIRNEGLTDERINELEIVLSKGKMVNKEDKEDEGEL